ncbi:putative serine/threonine-protein kinase drkA [Phytophthora citrophthora]|uniref:Serine/threonine-protein kinase drkA n=1 Tax=Phytophthora citrophthora TaxID=4793 RepID=A0AAD9G894_9STRA|nr:putative serine/threonine-protein kinase drkA [Phytophthora citrophthora]
MPIITYTNTDIALAITESISLTMGCTGLAVLVTLVEVLATPALCILAGISVVICVVCRVYTSVAKRKSAAILTIVVRVPFCIGVGILSILEITQEYRNHCHNDSSYEWSYCLDYDTCIIGGSILVFAFNIIDVVTSFIFWRRRGVDSDFTTIDDLVDPANSPRPSNDPLRNPVNLWDDDAITTARIPKDKIDIGPLLSRGGFGEVYKGTYNGLTVAVKKMLPAHRKNVAHVNNFLAEVKLLASLDHSCIVQFVGVAWDALSDVCAVTEFMDAGDLRGLLTAYHDENHPVGFDNDKVTIALHVAHALTYLHSLEPVVIHRDLKSRNILLTSDLSAKLTDFGVSRERADCTMTAGVGTSLWMAPEVLMGERYDDKADVFSFGVVLSELDLQVLPYAHATESSGSGRRMRDLAVLQRMAMGKLRVQFSPNATASMVELGLACVSLNPSDRPSAAEVLYKLQVIQRELLLL